MVTIVFESHATSKDNESGNASAKELGERYYNEKIDVVFCSDLARSYHTAEIAFEEKGVEIIKDVRLRECDYGERTRLSAASVEEEKASHISEPFPGGESYNQTDQRMRSFLGDLLRFYDGKKVMIIGHRATQYGLEHWLVGKTIEEAVTSPWKWQPGWTYHLEKLSD
jgi:2,3-bisphosphoglycerate-dependent phosphoglycerate mutase